MLCVCSQIVQPSTLCRCQRRETYYEKPQTHSISISTAPKSAMHHQHRPLSRSSSSVASASEQIAAVQTDLEQFISEIQSSSVAEVELAEANPAKPEEEAAATLSLSMAAHMWLSRLSRRCRWRSPCPVRRLGGRGSQRGDSRRASSTRRPHAPSERSPQRKQLPMQFARRRRK